MMLRVGKYLMAGLALGGAHARSTSIASVANERIHGHESFVDNDGVRIHYRSYGSGPLLVLQHGFPDRETTWNTFQIQEFAKKYTVVTPTLRGYPPSDVPPAKEDYAAAAYVSDMLAVIKAVGKDSAVIVGHDVGGVVVQKFASAHSDILKGLVMVNTPIIPVFLPLIEFDSYQQQLSEYTIPYYAYQPGQPKNVSTIVQHILNETYRHQIADYVHKSPLYGMLDFYNENFPAPPYGQNLSTEGLAQTVPSAIIWGELDPYFSPAMLNGLAAWFDYGIRLVVIPGAGHWSFRDRPTRFNAELKSFLDFLEY
ncbi:putative hydrolase [Trichoderma velutinum]